MDSDIARLVGLGIIWALISYVAIYRMSGIIYDEKALNCISKYVNISGVVYYY